MLRVQQAKRGALEGWPFTGWPPKGYQAAGPTGSSHSLAAGVSGAAATVEVANRPFPRMTLRVADYFKSSLQDAPLTARSAFRI